MNATEFTLWLNGYLEALETEGIKSIKIETIRTKLNLIKNSPNQERILFGPNINKSQQSYVHQTPTTREGL